MHKTTNVRDLIFRLNLHNFYNDGNSSINLYKYCAPVITWIKIGLMFLQNIFLPIKVEKALLFVSFRCFQQPAKMQISFTSVWHVSPLCVSTLCLPGFPPLLWQVQLLEHQADDQAMYCAYIEVEIMMDGWMKDLVRRNVPCNSRSILGMAVQIHQWISLKKKRPRVKNFSSPLVAEMNCVFWWDSSFSLSLWLIYFFATSLTVKFPSFLCEADWLTRLVSLLRLLSPDQLVKQLQLELSSAAAESFHLASRI